MKSKYVKGTKEDAKTWIDLVREVMSDVTDEEADFILWEFTAFPFADKDHIRHQIIKFRDESLKEKKKEGKTPKL